MKLLVKSRKPQTEDSKLLATQHQSSVVLCAAHLEQREHVTHDVAELEPSQVVDLDLRYRISATDK